MILFESFLILASFIYILIVVSFIRGWLKIKISNDLKVTREVKVSVIIPVRNESLHIKALIDDLMLQSYPKELFEIVVIDDHSTDDTAEIVKSIKADNLKLISLVIDNPTFAYKKKAVTMAIESSTAELIITTDGDCRVGKDWIKSIVSYYTNNNVKLISSPVSFHESGTWYEKVQTLEFQYLIGVGAACIQNKYPSTCNGANLAYTREVFFDVQGFDGVDSFAHGDDEMFLYKVNEKYPDSIGFLKSYDAIVYTHAKTKMSDFVQQRKRWASKSTKYYDWHVIVLVYTVYFLNLGLLIGLPFALMNGDFSKVYFSVLVAKSFTDGIFFLLTMKFYKNLKYFYLIPLTLFLYVFYIIIIGFIGNIGSTYTWKDREVK